MQFVIISGMSGAGKSRAASDLEDLGFYCVDNMPAEMIPQFAQLCLATKGRYEKVALVTDIRASMTFDALFQALQKLDDMHLQYSIYYIEASTAVIIKRYKETRRLHPLMKDGSTLEPGTVDAGNRHHANVLTVGGVWRGAEETGDNGREAVRKHGAVQARIAD